MAWTSQELVLYHGTTFDSAKAILATGVDLARCDPLTDFGRGFYTTTNLDQAMVWATLKARAVRAGGRVAHGAVLQLIASRSWLAELEAMAFVRDAPETGFADFVRYCRSGGAPHRPSDGDLQLIYGPVVIWQGIEDPSHKLFVMQDTDQLSFHAPESVNASSPLIQGGEITWKESSAR